MVVQQSLVKAIVQILTIESLAGTSVKPVSFVVKWG